MLRIVMLFYLDETWDERQATMAADELGNRKRIGSGDDGFYCNFGCVYVWNYNRQT
ncbi:hypothetical protein G4Y79_08230 [Phototrophicus methaneseepsis]|uniref:Uncharacterized protein n=1 Tax=Phototrophicus methaneseepsis TaxID=2710758 RepID=A0A7S8ECA9_9CHLR|nr:hypothetical protein [Phototrophicus methaneseepsis]QPC84348.1 hypothetical protein G4Y79_08230 [Phototrophicus methaneseepsis]